MPHLDHATVLQTLTSTHADGPEAQTAALLKLPAPSPETNDKLWTFLVQGLVILVGIALVSLVALVAFKRYDAVVLTVFTSLLTGLLGLFVDKPA